MKSQSLKIPKFNTDRLELINEIHALSLQRNYQISIEEITECVEQFEGLLSKYGCRADGTQYIWRIKDVLDLFTEGSKGGNTKFTNLMLKTFNEEFVRLFNK